MEKTTKNGIHRITQADGKTIAWAEESGVKVLEKDGYYFKDLAKTGELLPYETGVFPMRRERQTLRVVFRLKRLQAYAVLAAPGGTADAGRTIPGNV